MISTAFITGTGFYSLPGMKNNKACQAATPYGEVALEIAEFAGQEIAFLPRHGAKHAIAPGEINYRANIFALKGIGVRCILSTSVCGSLEPSWGPGSLILVDQFLNFTSGRAETFYPLDGRLAHIDVTEPYCRTLHNQLVQCSQALGIHLVRGGTYACFNGPRFETRAEIEMTRRLGGQLVGQTNYPECVLARELEMCYATLGVVSNFAAGIGKAVTTAEVFDHLKLVEGMIPALFTEFIKRYPEAPDCSCQHALQNAFV
jgi:5'-methylthioadenosine phosphorylase